MSKYTVVGPRILLKVAKAKDTYEGTSIMIAESLKEDETVTKTKGVILQIGPTAKTEYNGFDDLAEGQTVHFQRYGAQRIGIKEEEEFEHWVINAKDILAINNEESN